MIKLKIKNADVKKFIDTINSEMQKMKCFYNVEIKESKNKGFKIVVIG